MVAVFPEGISHDEVTQQPLQDESRPVRARGRRRGGRGGAGDGRSRTRLRRQGPAFVPAPSFGSGNRSETRAVGPGPSALRTGDRADGHQDLAGQLDAWFHPSPRRSRPSSSPGSPSPSSVRRGPLGDVGLADTVHVAARLVALQDECPRRWELLSDSATPRAAPRTAGPRATPGWWWAPSATARLSVPWSPCKLLVARPAAVGALVHLIPFQIMKQVGKRPTNEGIKATVKLLGCFVLFAATYALVGVLVGRVDGRGPGSPRHSPHRCAALSRCDCWNESDASAAWSRGTGSSTPIRTSSDRCCAPATVMRDARVILRQV